MTEITSQEWASPAHALNYLARADSMPHRTEGEAELLDCLPPRVSRVLDLGSGGGRLLELVRLARPAIDACVALDFSPTMLAALAEKFGGDGRVTVVAHDMEHSLPPLGSFDAVVSSFAIHHLPHERKRALFEEVHRLLTPGGVFLNLEHVASATAALHECFLGALGLTLADEDRSNKLLDVETQLGWLRELGFIEVDCHWKWRELALLAAVRE
jgi:SAM-dependent methyltransferase